MGARPARGGYQHACRQQWWHAGSLGRRRGLGAGARLKIGRGAVVVVELDPTIGHEQSGVRPCIVVSDPDVIGDQRFPLVCVVPVTGTPGEGLLYPPLAPGQSGLAKKSFALIDHLRSIDKRRIRRTVGPMTTLAGVPWQDVMLLKLLNCNTCGDRANFAVDQT